MPQRALILGGAGFIGSHLTDELLARGYQVRIFDSLSPQVHGEAGRIPNYLNPGADFVRGDVCDARELRAALTGVEVVFHLAAVVGVGQSMYEVRRYVHTNDLGTAVLMETLADRPVGRLVVASSMSIYGEGLYRTARGELRAGQERSVAQLRAGDWELRDEAGGLLEPVPTPETKSPALPSVYALTKYQQELTCLRVGRAYRIPTVGLRFFNVFGPRQALSNPYTGVLAIFASRFLRGKPPLINEDGYQRRDFVSVHDVVQACCLAAERPAETVADAAYNVGSGRSYTIRQVAELLAAALGRAETVPQLTKRYRVGDIRHCFADVRLAREQLGYAPRHFLEETIGEMAAWTASQAEQMPADDGCEQALAELTRRGLTV